MPFELQPHPLAEAISKFIHIVYLKLGVVSHAGWITNILLYIPLGYLAAMWLAQSHHSGLIAAMLLCLGLVIGVELTQVFFSSHTVSMSNLFAETLGSVIGIALWLSGHTPFTGLIKRLRHASPSVLTSSSLLQFRSSRFSLVVGAIILLTVVGIGAILINKSSRIETEQLSHNTHELPTPENLAPVNLPNFRLQHPRLPAPTVAEIARLKNENPQYLSKHRALAKGEKGKLDSAIIMAYLEPGSQDLNLMLTRLLDLKLNWRGGTQGKLLAQAYDWLYDEWNEEQRQQLRGKLIQGCDYLVDYIRTHRLSPYNVIFYNNPFQALVACSIALYKDDPRGEPVMAFTQDLWKNRVLPVWRQVMGKNGGWHEGGEYVGIGIGDAVYQVPNMWRHATGEDYFKTEPGIRGFLDFLVYRTRPDGTHFRLGDAAFFDRDSSDRLALALEYRYAAAYSVGKKPPKTPTPTSWPWGPLTDPSLYDPNAAEQLPLTKHFDGIGLVVMRSGWGPDATYITFKAGDNYWSHNHLDQGAFTIYKGGELAIDSGLYTDYGSDHHMNYTYQTIAHNVVTVTDPNDTEPMPERANGKPPRSIANDGGQRRVGSGWGIDPAPLDIDEWNAKREIYHTGKITRIEERDDVTIITADLTPAYTNHFSGKGTFSHRTRRVERYIRTFVYDRLNDAVIVYDQISTSKPEFKTRWHLHTLQEPVLSSDSFHVNIAPTTHSAHSGGILKGKILIPAQAQINAIGGPGREFYVGNTNYDNGGEVYHTMKRRPLAEPGAWRIEIASARAAKEHEFLTVMLVSNKDNGNSPQTARLLNENGRIGCELSGINGPRQIWFDQNQF